MLFSVFTFDSNETSTQLLIITHEQNELTHLLLRTFTQLLISDYSWLLIKHRFEPSTCPILLIFTQFTHMSNLGHRAHALDIGSNIRSMVVPL